MATTGGIDSGDIRDLMIDGGYDDDDRSQTRASCRTRPRTAAGFPASFRRALDHGSRGFQRILAAKAAFITRCNGSRASSFTPEATKYLIEIAADKGEDTRNRIVAMSMLYDRAWGKAKEFDPHAETAEHPPLDASHLTAEQRQQLRDLLLLATATSNDHDSNAQGRSGD